jgi:Trk K+ transport system NAD-binding subunit
MIHTADHPATGRPNGQTETLVVGGGHLGHELARRLEASGARVTLVDDQTAPQPPPDLRVRLENRLDGAALSHADPTVPTVVVAVSAADSTNLLVAQHAKRRDDVDRVVVRVNDPERASVFEDLGIEVVNGPATLGRIIAEERL